MLSLSVADSCEAMADLQISEALSCQLTAVKKVQKYMTEPLELEGTFKDHLVQLPCKEQGHHS